jgi:Sulfotransferase family
MFPNTHYLFMYRDVVKVSKSLYRIAYPLPSIWLAFKLGRLSGSLTEKVIESMGIDGRDYHHRLRDDMELGVLLFCLLTRVYLDLKHSGRTDVVGVRYEDLVDNSAETIRRILEHCHLPAELVTPALRGLEVDSQRNSMLAKDAIGSLPEPALTPDVIVRANEWLGKTGLPLVGEECLIEGTITCSKKPVSVRK